jgi:hypothetical protein
MKNTLKNALKDGTFDESSSYLLSKELEFQLAKSFLAFAMAFIGGIVTLKTALAIDTPIEEGFTAAIGAAILAVVFSFQAQQSVIKDLQLKRNVSPLRRFARLSTPLFVLGTEMGIALSYFFQ